MKSLVPKLSAALIGIALACAVLEIGLRLAPQAISPHMLILFEPDLRSQIAGGSLMVKRDFVAVERNDGGPPLFVWKPTTRISSIDERGVDSQPSTDEIGFCNPDGIYNGHETLDIVAIGDSFTWCHGVKAEQGWVYLLGQQLHQTSYNLGRGGSGIYEYVQLLQRFGLPKKPRVVVLNVYEGNDLRDAYLYWEYRKELERTGRPPPEERETVLPSVTHGPLGRHSYAANLALAFATRLWDRNVTDREETAIDFSYTLDLPGGAVPFNEENRDTGEVLYARRLRDGDVSLELWDDALRSFSELAQANGFTPVVTYTPSTYTSYAGRVRFADKSLTGLLREQSEKQRAFLQERAQTLGFAFHDLTPALVEAAAQSDAASLLYNSDSLHLTPAGHEAIAASLAKFLVERGLGKGSG